MCQKRFYMLNLFFIISLCYTNAIPIDNGIVGEPEIECGPVSIAVSLSTRNTFDGHVYVKGRYDEAGCRSDEGGLEVASITLPFNTCGVSRIRSLNPRGVYVSTTIIVTFHPQFLTKVDRAYKVECFYMEAEKTVSSELEVSEVATQFISHNVPMPICRYEVLSGGPNGDVVAYATIGQQVYHKWTCDSETQDTFCMKVHSCSVDDGKGDSVEIIDSDGCAKDKYVLNNLEYPTDLMAGQEAHIYKFADRSQLFFQCQISLSIKEPHEDCPRPVCTPLRRKKRNTGTIGTIDVVSQSIEALDIGVTPESFGINDTLTNPDLCVASLNILFASVPLIASVVLLVVVLLIRFSSISISEKDVLDISTIIR